MTLEASHTSPEFSKPVEEKLSKAQKAIIERVIAILDTDPKLKEALNKALEASFADIV